MIFNPPFGARKLNDVAKIADSLGYTMFAFNGIVRETKTQNELFNLSDLIN